MSIQNDILAFAIGGGANVLSQADYLSSSQLGPGQQPGIAASALNNKALRQGTFVAQALAQFIGNASTTNIQDNGSSVQLLAQITSVLTAYPSVLTQYKTGGASGTFKATFMFQIASGNANSGATYTNNTNTYTVVNTVSAGTVLQCTGAGLPTSGGTLTKASGTGDATIVFYAYRNAKEIRFRGVGGGGGGAGGGSTQPNGGNGGDTTFGGVLTAGGGQGGQGGQGGAGGSPSLTGGLTGANFVGGSGSSSGANGGVSTAYTVGGSGGYSAFGGGGAGGFASGNGSAGATNTGGGGGGGSGPETTNDNGGAGGGSGAYAEGLFTGSLLATIITSGAAYAVGAAGTAGSSGGTSTGAAGGSGYGEVLEIF